MKTILIAFSALIAASALGVIAALAHPAAIPHAHPHLHTVDGALLGFDALTLIALGLFGVAIATATVLARARRKK